MAFLILDEWLWSDAACENGVDRQRETIRFVVAIFEICDRIVVVRGSRFQQKAEKFWKHTDSVRRTFSKFFNKSILYNSAKGVLVDPDELAPLPQNVTQEIQLEDRYLVQAQLAMPESMVITTDIQLKTILDRYSIPCKHRDNYLPQYLSENQLRMPALS